MSALTNGNEGLGDTGAGIGATTGIGAGVCTGSSVLASSFGLTAAVVLSSEAVWRVIGTGVNLLGGTGVTATAAPVGLALPLAARSRFSSSLRL